MALRGARDGRAAAGDRCRQPQVREPGGLLRLHPARAARSACASCATASASSASSSAIATAHGRVDAGASFLQPEGFGKGTFRPYHAETTIGGLFNRVRLEHMDREGIDHQVIYGSLPLAFNSLMDARARRRAVPRLQRLHPRRLRAPRRAPASRSAHLALQDPGEALRELRRCVLELGMVAAVACRRTCRCRIPPRPSAFPDDPRAEAALPPGLLAALRGGASARTSRSASTARPAASWPAAAPISSTPSRWCTSSPTAPCSRWRSRG